MLGDVKMDKPSGVKKLSEPKGLDEVSIGKPPEMVEFPVFPVPKDWRDVTMGKPPGVGGAETQGIGIYYNGQAIRGCVVKIVKTSKSCFGFYLNLVYTGKRTLMLKKSIFFLSFRFAFWPKKSSETPWKAKIFLSSKLLLWVF